MLKKAASFETLAAHHLTARTNVASLIRDRALRCALAGKRRVLAHLGRAGEMDSLLEHPSAILHAVWSSKVILVPELWQWLFYSLVVRKEAARAGDRAGRFEG